MAHVQKYTKGNVQGLSIHWDRKTENHSNLDIDNEQSDLNYDLCEKEGDTLSRMNQRLSEVYVFKRNDVKVCADWVVTLPENLKGISEKEQREFFEKTYEFLANRYGREKNVLSANVHMDETTPHIHFAFMPVVWDEKKQREKVSAKEVLTRKDLKTFHQDLDKFLKKELLHIYKGGILNDKTIGVDTVKDLKKHSEEIQKQKDEMTAECKEQEQKLEKEIQSVNKELESKKKELLDLSGQRHKKLGFRRKEKRKKQRL
ncbi:MobV family relaxase [Bacillus cereus]